MIILACKSDIAQHTDLGISQPDDDFDQAGKVGAGTRGDLKVKSRYFLLRISSISGFHFVSGDCVLSILSYRTIRSVVRCAKQLELGLAFPPERIQAKWFS